MPNNQFANELLKNHWGIGYQEEEKGILRLLAEIGKRCTGADEVSLLILDRENNELVFAMTVGSDEAEKNLLGQRIPVGQGHTGLAVVTGDIQFGAPIYLDVKQEHMKTESGKVSPNAVLAAPMMVNDTVIGVLTAVSFVEGFTFTRDNGQLYGMLASLAAMVVSQQKKITEFMAKPDSQNGGLSLTVEQEQQAAISLAVSKLMLKRADRLADVASLLSSIDKICR